MSIELMVVSGVEHARILADLQAKVRDLEAALASYEETLGEYQAEVRARDGLLAWTHAELRKLADSHRTLVTVDFDRIIAGPPVGGTNPLGVHGP